jgi:hypothetical protein
LVNEEGTPRPRSDGASTSSGYNSAELGETVYLLVADRATATVRNLLESFRPSSSIDGVPSGWTLYGPGALTLLSGQSIEGLPMRKNWQAVPRLVGGLEVARRTFLVGGPPAVFVPADSAMAPCLDGESLAAAIGDGSVFELRQLNLGSGRHWVDVGPYRLTFEMRAFGRLPHVALTVGRTMLGSIIRIHCADGQPVFVGGARLPETDYDPIVISPLGARLVVLGLPGQAVECLAMMCPWAEAAGLPQLLFEPTQHCSYRAGRPFSPIRWVAAQDAVTRTWSVTQVQRSSPPCQAGTAVDPLARDVVTAIGFDPVILRDGRQDDSAAIAEEWVEYARSVIGTV